MSAQEPEKPPEKVWLAYCPACECVTEMEKTGTVNEGICNNCGLRQDIKPNQIIMQEILVLERQAEATYSRWLMLKDAIASREKTLAPIEVTPKPRWKRHPEVSECSRCGRKTHWTINSVPHCYGECKPRVTTRKTGFDDLPVELQQKLREMFNGGQNDDDDFETMKFHNGD